MKGIVLAGGSGTRLHPITIPVSKQLLPVGDKPMIYYPLSVLLLAGIRDILLIGKSIDLPHFRRLLGDGSHLGVEITYAAQDVPRGVAEALVIGADHIGAEPCALILGDNIFHGSVFSKLLRDEVAAVDGCTLFGYPVSDPERYGVGVLDEQGRLVSLEEKPLRPHSNRAVTGLYFYDADVVARAAALRPSARGELEITDLNQQYLADGRAKLIDLGRGYAWLDAGTPEALMQASQYVRTIEERQGVRIACLEETALRMGFIGADDCYRLGVEQSGSAYGRYVMEIARELGADS
ncbi:glucose-1-phosphate thymidylyltransferase RfbA [Actinoplanes teichomyceticus]|uniref:Glucose-1-phosphate thymidylyltransferase n=1 Tax=Actinoplanes teichomyceticus TaxID=1867 RepID=A0A561WBS4_ACTTI|nr:glucose-1-phosphate thymidylyltransferase RfbA [Actinoplanes teichomyceticus]TWG21318.1 glucose-1-phosphate thymidylyltransferase [Actinoplanes teichomyceticus]GIF16402.1 glucose-1-phosphate thymidylyltransferase [Actinoplanes teichomyceticus]